MTPEPSQIVDVGTGSPDAPGVLQPTNTTGTGLAADIANTLASSQANCYLLNTSHQFQYDGAVRNYNANMESGQKHNPPLTPPIAPAKWVVLPPDENGLQEYGPSSTEFLTPTPPLKLDTTDLGSLASITPSNAPQWQFKGIGPLVSGSTVLYSALFGDTMPGGFEMAIDGHKYTRIGYIFGWGYWLRTA